MPTLDMFCNIAIELSMELSGLLGLELLDEAAETAVASWTCCMYWASAACWARAVLLVAAWDCEALTAACSCWMAAVCEARAWKAEYCSDSPVRYSCIRFTDPESDWSGVLIIKYF